MTSYEAVESGARVLIEDGRYGVPWEDASEDDRAEAMARVRTILEAAAPHMLAGVWDEAIEAYKAWTWDDENMDPPTNPYRLTR
ncbi:hypothetical protein ACFFGR_09280 [Arthrobacter liuii]|uniref:Uncharacterized protein n=1 Tax=Arthrobacter liuii TaxID=1476996 RepID=A0ABQ2AQG0_9MICC|nr:hypothetical protein [Arthrobacter liuii]GGH93811.1 hypothetical protein GCM10007170_15550 [Arthrobacter liuii]